MIFKRLAPFLLAFVLPLVLVYAWWGGFNPVSMGTETRGPYTYAYLEQTGDYSKLPNRQNEVRMSLEAQGVAPGHGITVLYSNPDVVEVNARRARAGYLVPEGSVVREPLHVDSIPARRVLAARVQAGALLAPSRVYSVLDRHLQASGQGIRMPTVEIFEASGSPFRMGWLTVEVPEQ